MVVYGEGNNLHVQRIKLLFLLIEIIIGKDIWLLLSRRENAIFAVIDPGVLESPPSRRPFLPHFAIMREHVLPNLVSAIIKLTGCIQKPHKSKISRWPTWNVYHRFVITVRTESQAPFETPVRLYTVFKHKFENVAGCFSCILFAARHILF